MNINKKIKSFISFILILMHLTMVFATVPSGSHSLNSDKLNNQALAPKSQITEFSVNEVLISVIIQELIEKNRLKSRNILQKFNIKRFIKNRFNTLKKLENIEADIQIDFLEKEDYSGSKNNNKDLLITITTPSSAIQTINTIFVDINGLILRQQKEQLKQPIILKYIKTVFDGIRDISTGLVKVIQKTWKIATIILITSVLFNLVPPTYAATESPQLKSTTSIVETQAGPATFEEASDEIKRIDAEYNEYILKSLIKTYYKLYYKNDPAAYTHGHLPSFKEAANNYAVKKATALYKKVVGGINHTLSQQAEKFLPHILEVAELYSIDPSLLLTITTFETWDLTVGETKTDIIKGAVTEATSVGPYQIRIDKMRKILKPLFDLEGSARIAINIRYPLLEKFKTMNNFNDFLEKNYNGGLADALSSNKRISTELAAIYLKNMEGELKRNLPGIFDKDFNINNIEIKNDNDKNKWNIFFLSYTFGLLEKFSGEDVSMSTIFQYISDNHPDLELWFKGESKLLISIKERVIEALKTGSSEDIGQALSPENFRYTSKHTVPANIQAQSMVKYFTFGGIGILLLAGGAIAYYKLNPKESTSNTAKPQTSKANKTNKTNRTNRVISRNRRKKNINISDILDGFNSSLTSLLKLITSIPKNIMKSQNKNRRVSKRNYSRRVEKLEQYFSTLIEIAGEDKTPYVDGIIIEMMLKNYGFKNINLGYLDRKIDEKKNRKMSVEELKTIIKNLKSHQTVEDSFRAIRHTNAIFQQAA